MLAMLSSTRKRPGRACSGVSVRAAGRPGRASANRCSRSSSSSFQDPSHCLEDRAGSTRPAPSTARPSTAYAPCPNACARRPATSASPSSAPASPLPNSPPSAATPTSGRAPGRPRKRSASTHRPSRELSATPSPSRPTSTSTRSSSTRPLRSSDTPLQRKERTHVTKQFAGKSALITGGGSGIGRASALALAAEGALVTVTGRTEETLPTFLRAGGGASRGGLGRPGPGRSDRVGDGPAEPGPVRRRKWSWDSRRTRLHPVRRSG